MGSIGQTLAVVSPHKRGKVVEEAQWLLNGHNRLNRDFYTGKLDGEFGPLVGAACVKAKFWLGYPKQDLKPIYGDLLRGYLVLENHPAAKKLPLTYQLRRKARIAASKKATKEQTTRVKALEVARSFSGYREGSNNDSTFGRWYGMNFNPWCAFFVSYCITKAGGKFHESYCPTIKAKADASRDGLTITNDPKPGDIFVVDWNRDGTFDHTGFFDHWIDREAGTFRTMEGNTLPENGVGNQSNGGGAYPRDRDLGDGRFVFIDWN